MRFGTLLLIVVLLAAGYYLWTQWNQPPPPPAPAPVQPAAQRITCPACKGEGQLMMRGEAQQKGSGGHIRDDKPYACPICGSIGYRTWTLPGGAIVCPDCQGMGKRLYDPRDMRVVDFGTTENIRLHGAPCKRCNSKGYLKTPPAR